eukprot:3739742-Lingulodinium_polyedra.AAC.1
MAGFVAHIAPALLAPLARITAQTSRRGLPCLPPRPDLATCSPARPCCHDCRVRSACRRRHP